VVYREHGDRIRVLKTKSTRPEQLPLRALWSPTGGHRDSEKAKLNIEAVMR